jgi:hypothetical protein
MLGRLDRSGSMYRVRTYRPVDCSRIVSNAWGFPSTILNRSHISPTPVKFHAQFILGYQTRLEVNYYLRLLVSELCGLLLWGTTLLSELCGLLLWSTTWLFLNCVGCCCGTPRGCF